MILKDSIAQLSITRSISVLLVMTCLDTSKCEDATKFVPQWALFISGIILPLLLCTLAPPSIVVQELSFALQDHPWVRWQSCLTPVSEVIVIVQCLVPSTLATLLSVVPLEVQTVVVLAGSCTLAHTLHWFVILVGTVALLRRSLRLDQTTVICVWVVCLHVTCFGIGRSLLFLSHRSLKVFILHGLLQVTVVVFWLLELMRW